MEKNYTKGKLNLRQRRFVEEYLRCGKACEAAERAGYLRSYAQGVMRQPAVKKLLEDRRKEIIDQAKITNDMIQRLIECVEQRTTIEELRKSKDASAIAAAEVLCRVLGLRKERKKND